MILRKQSYSIFIGMPSISATKFQKFVQSAGVDLAVEETRFRPNIFITGDFPGFQEDM